jgi:hypothetical protein
VGLSHTEASGVNSSDRSMHVEAAGGGGWMRGATGVNAGSGGVT